MKGKDGTVDGAGDCFGDFFGGLAPEGDGWLRARFGRSSRGTVEFILLADG